MVPALLRRLLLAVLALGAVGARAADAITLQLKWRHQWQFAGYYAALEQGYYREAGLDVRLREPAEAENPVDAVLQGRAEYGIAGSDLVLRRGQGAPVVSLGAIFQHSPLVLLVPAKPGMDSVQALAGKRVLLESDAEELVAYFKAEGIDPARVHFITHRFTPDDLVRGEAEAMSGYLTDEVYALRAARFPALALSPRSAGIDFYGDVLFTTASELERHPERVRAFREATFRGWRYAFDHPEELADLILTRYSTRHTREHLVYEARESRELVLPDLVELGYQHEGRWRHIAETYRSLGLLQAEPDLRGFIYGRPPERDPRPWFAVGLVGALALGVAALAWRFRRLSTRLQEELAHVHTLRGLIPICASCKRIRDDGGFWEQVEQYITAHSEAKFSHGICPDCAKELYPGWSGNKREKAKA